MSNRADYKIQLEKHIQHLQDVIQYSATGPQIFHLLAAKNLQPTYSNMMAAGPLV